MSMFEVIEAMEKQIKEEQENEKVYRDPEWLKSNYEKTGSIFRMAEIAGCSYRTIHKWMVKNNIHMHSMKGQKHTPEAIAKIGAASKARHGSMAGRKMSAETRQKMSEQRKGAKNGNWKGGVTEKVRKFRRSKEYMRWRKEVLERAGYACEECGSTKDVEAHHVVSLYRDFSKALDINNGQALCRECHKKKDWRNSNDDE